MFFGNLRLGVKRKVQATQKERVETEYGFEASQEILEKMHASDESSRLIKEDGVKDLRYVSVAGNPYRFWKRLLDLVIAAGGLLLGVIPSALVCLVIYVDDPGPVFFSQYRVGRGGKRFKIYKFRTMKSATPHYLSTAEIEEPNKYITRFGHLLRKSSIDEFPQFYNVLKGDMSMIGPRPLISDEFEIHEMRTRFGVYQIRPGITGLAQIMGRDTVSPEEKVRWDVKYLKRFGFRQDVHILLSTCFKVLRREGIVEGTREGSAATVSGGSHEVRP